MKFKTKFRPELPTSEVPVKIETIKTKSQNEKDMTYDINRYKFFDSKRKLKQSSVSGGSSSSSSSSSTGTVPVPVEKPAVPTIVEFACSDESELGKWPY